MSFRLFVLAVSTASLLESSRRTREKKASDLPERVKVDIRRERERERGSGGWEEGREGGESPETKEGENEMSRNRFGKNG